MLRNLLLLKASKELTPLISNYYYTNILAKKGYFFGNKLNK
ncbi:hypothetical protein C2W58_01705 [Bacillus pumilus]|uniref:Uncharacterized protein n=1 Tax=Bacillus pumilus TaxID=1408 RepID=A0AB34QUZ2_BACPU|nr:hypothetical protein B4127_3827 [Bacillus pumilus]RAP16053.1 hypothetical protein C2W58_01705 [Bacillus pumilus]